MLQFTRFDIFFVTHLQMLNNN